jgi:hypothetical protein
VVQTDHATEPCGRWRGGGAHRVVEGKVLGAVELDCPGPETRHFWLLSALHANTKRHRKPIYYGKR